MKNRLLFILSGLGLVLGLVSAYIYSQPHPAQPPVFDPTPNPYAKGIFANGIIESDQPGGENINLYPEVSGVVTRVLVAEGQSVKQGSPLLQIEDSVQRATAAQLRAQADAAEALLEELRAQPRRETLDVAKAQVAAAQANLTMVQSQGSKLERSYQADSRSVSQDALDNARNAESGAAAALQVAQRQYELTRAGAWSYDIRSQESQARALARAADAAEAQLRKYSVAAPVDGAVLSMNAAVGNYVSPQGVYGSYTGGADPVAVMGTAQDSLAVRVYVDEILVPRLPDAARIQAQMSVRGTDIKLPLSFVRTQPYVSPKIELSTQRQERVDVRVLPVIFRFDKPSDLRLYPGQLVDVYIGKR